MKKFIDTKVYVWWMSASFVLAVICGAIASYSMYHVEPKIQALLDEGEIMYNDIQKSEDKIKTEAEVSELYTKAYVLLRDPQIFARYEYYDSEAAPIKQILVKFDKIVADGKKIQPDHKLYLDVLYKRRLQGSKLTFSSMIFFLSLTALAGVFLIIEKVKTKNF